MKKPTLEDRAFWVAVKAIHAARIDPHPGKRCEALGALRNYHRAGSTDPQIVEPMVSRLESRHGPHRRADGARMALWPDRRTVTRYEASYALTGRPPGLDILDTGKE